MSIIRFFEDAYVGIRPLEPNEEIPLAFLTPDGTDSAAKKRKETVNDWTDPRRRGGKAEFKTFKNEPISGFKILSSVTRWSTSNKLFRVVDPRGFQLEISANNLVKILLCTSVDKGIINGDCVWARDRDSGNNILIPVGSEEYQEAMKNLKMSKSTDTAVPGNSVVLQTGEEGVYLGKFSIVLSKHTIRELEVIKVDSSLEARVKLKFAKVTDPTTLSRDEAYAIISAPNAYLGTTLNSGVLGVFKHKTTKKDVHEQLKDFTPIEWGRGGFMIKQTRSDDMFWATRLRKMINIRSALVYYESKKVVSWFDVKIDEPNYFNYHSREEGPSFNLDDVICFNVYLQNKQGEQVKVT